MNKNQILPFAEINNFSKFNDNQRWEASIFALNELNKEFGVEVNKESLIDKVFVDNLIANIDGVLAKQVDEILHDEEFQKLEATWRSLEYLLNQIEPQSNVKVELIDVSKEELDEDFKQNEEITQTGLYKQLYTYEYDTPGGEPISAIVSDFQITNPQDDAMLLRKVASVCAVTHCPFIANIRPEFFGKKDYDSVLKIYDLKSHFEQAEYIHWNMLRESENARYIGLTMPNILMRLPYNNAKRFNYRESCEVTENYLWGHASFAFASNLASSFQSHGWAVNIRGIQSGGKVKDLLLHYFDMGGGRMLKPPVETLVPETNELQLAELGFIPMCYYKNSDYACFFSANSIQQAKEYQKPEATANARVNSRLPYVFLVSRIGHYLKVLQRQSLGANRTAIELKDELNNWLQTLITKMNAPDQTVLAKHPLREAYVNVNAIDGRPGYYAIDLCIVPHMQIEGVDVKLSLAAQLPGTEQ